MFIFLSVLVWIPRKAWRILVRAWFEEFGRQDDVTLPVKTDTSLSPGAKPSEEIDAFVRSELNGDTKDGSGVVVLDRPMELTDVPRLYRAADAFVVASHGEGWGRPHMEATAMGLPTIGIRWSGNLDFMNDLRWVGPVNEQLLDDGSNRNDRQVRSRPVGRPAPGPHRRWPSLSFSPSARRRSCAGSGREP